MEESKRSTPTFDELYQQLFPTLTEMEHTRKEMLRSLLRKSLIWGGIVILIAVVLGVFAAIDFLAMSLGGLLITLVIAGGIAGNLNRQFCKQYKENIVSVFVKAIIEKGTYTPKKGIPQSIFRGCNLFSNPDRYSSEDLITGEIGKTSIMFSEVHAEERHTTTDSKGRTRTSWVTIFRGFIFSGDFHKDFSGRTELHRRSWLKKFNGKRVKLEDPRFEKCFDVYATDQVEARYILSLSMMERILALEEKFKGKRMVISFWQSNVIIAVQDGKNRFECNIWQSVTDSKKLLEEYNIISSFAAIVEDLNLNLRIWTKQ